MLGKNDFYCSLQVMDRWSDAWTRGRSQAGSLGVLNIRGRCKTGNQYEEGDTWRGLGCVGMLAETVPGSGGGRLGAQVSMLLGTAPSQWRGGVPE